MSIKRANKKGKRRWGWEVWPGLPKNIHLGGWSKLWRSGCRKARTPKIGCGRVPISGLQLALKLESFTTFWVSVAYCCRYFYQIDQSTDQMIEICNHATDSAAGPAQIISTAKDGTHEPFFGRSRGSSRGHVGRDPDGGYTCDGGFGYTFSHHTYTEAYAYAVILRTRMTRRTGM